MILGGPIPGLAHNNIMTCFHAFALLTCPAILSHPVRPKVWTGVATVVALGLWLFSGWLTVVILTFAG